MHLIENNHAEIVNRSGSRIDHVSENFGSHDNNRGIRVNAVVASK